MKNYKWEETIDSTKGVTYGFKVAEPKKQRARPVWACRINKYIKEFQSYRSSVREEVYDMMANNDWFIELDVKSMYDHFVLDEKVRNFFQFISKNDAKGRLKLLPMGFGPSAIIAQSTIFKLLDFHKSSVAASCIDNMGLANVSKEKLIEDAIRLVDRTAQVNFTLNDLPTPLEWKALNIDQKKNIIKHLVSKRFDFLGVHYNLTSKTRSNTKKTVDKIHSLLTILRNEGEITNRGIASIIGVYRYASEILDYDMTQRFQELRQLRIIISEGVRDIQEWDKVCPNVNYKGLISWGEALIDNIPVEIVKQRIAGERSLIITDASGEGWGAILVKKDVLIERHGSWSSPLRHSSEAEPKAIEMALEAFKYQISDRVLILSDHENLVHAIRSRAPKGYFYNCLKSYLINRHVNREINLKFIAGVDNPADGISRNRVFSQEDRIKSKSLYVSLLGAGSGHFATQPSLYWDSEDRPDWM
eukprot:Tbor_TRINITY_DN5879_c1_g5::TRINITY_DN5879_c1_g5_i1::g.7108::m.7108